MNRIFKIAIALVGMCALAWVVYVLAFASNDKVIVGKGKIDKVDTMVELCSIDFYNEVPIIDTVQNWVCFAKQKQRGSISFDIENLDIDANADSVLIILPPEIIDIMEATDDKAWETVDSKDLKWLQRLSTSRAPVEVWSIVKKNALIKSKKNLYQAGIVERARMEGAENLQTLMEKVYNKPVKVTDPTPKGAHFEEYK